MLTNSAGCKIVRNFDLTINNSNTSVDVQEHCDNNGWDGNTYTVSNNTATFTLTNSAGCDSVVTSDLPSTTVTLALMYKSTGYIYLDRWNTTLHLTTLQPLRQLISTDSVVTLIYHQQQ